MPDFSTTNGHTNGHTEGWHDRSRFSNQSAGTVIVMGSTIEDGARLSIANAIEADLEDDLAAVGVRIVYEPNGDGSFALGFCVPFPIAAVGAPLFISFGRSPRLPDMRAVNREWRTQYCLSPVSRHGNLRQPTGCDGRD